MRFGIVDELHCEPLLPGWRRALADIFAEEASAEAVAGEVAVAWRAEGVEIGRAEGVEIGIAQRNVELVRAMVQEGMAVPLIAKLTGLAPEEVTKLLT